MPEQSRAFESCYAKWQDDRLAIGNAHIERRWRIADGLLVPESLRDHEAGIEWFARPSRRSAPHRPSPFPRNPGKSPSTRPTAPSAPPRSRPCGFGCAREENGFPSPIGYRYSPLRAASPPVLSRRAVLSATTSLGPPPARSTARTRPPARKPMVTHGIPLPAFDCLERFAASPTHLRFTQVTFQDQTDAHNELVFEREWLLHPNEALLERTGNLFIIEDTLTGAGLLFLKHAPLPHARPLQDPCDARVFGRAAGAVHGEGFGPGHPAYPLAYEFAFYGHGLGARSGAGYPFVLLAYTGGRLGCIEVLQTYQRQFRRFDPTRDCLFVSNTWGDRSRDARISHTFIKKEIEAAADLGVDVIQIDDGWQRGHTQTSVRGGTAWEGYWDEDAHFWEPDPERFPKGLAPLARAAHENGMRLGLWYGPDSFNDFAHWRRDADRLLDLHCTHGVDHFKLDSIKARTKQGEANLHRLLDAVLEESQGAVACDLDITAEIRPGYFGRMDSGPLFVENRYSDWRRYWPHQTLRNLWRLAHYVDPRRLRMEFLNNHRNAGLYGDDPLAPAHFTPEYLFATVMFANPLGWFEVSGLPPEYGQGLPGLVRVWKEHREALFTGHIFPIGDPPDGTAWTGFLSVDLDARGGYLLLFRELNRDEEWTRPLPQLRGEPMAVTALWGNGELLVEKGTANARLLEPGTFLFARIQAL